MHSYSKEVFDTPNFEAHYSLLHQELASRGVFKTGHYALLFLEQFHDLHQSDFVQTQLPEKRFSYQAPFKNGYIEYGETAFDKPESYNDSISMTYWVPQSEESEDGLCISLSQSREISFTAVKRNRITKEIQDENRREIIRDRLLTDTQYEACRRWYAQYGDWMYYTIGKPLNQNEFMDCRQFGICEDVF